MFERKRGSLVTKETVSKSTILGIGVTAISGGVEVIKSNLTNPTNEALYGGIALLIVGLILVIVFAILLHEQVIEIASKKAAREVYAKLDERLKKIERGRSD